MKEKRKYNRFTINQMIEISVGKETIINSAGLNISEGGIYFKTNKELDPYSRLFVLITIPGGDDSLTFSCEGSVIRCEKVSGGYEAAMEFGEICSSDRDWIKKHKKQLEG